jgi:hypothetical protein
MVNWIMVRTIHGIDPGQPPISVEVEPLVLEGRKLKIQVDFTSPGDVNLDYRVDISDASAILGQLFLGDKEAVCREAGDFNDDSRLDLSDAIAILSFLFLGGKAPADRPITCGTGSVD